MNVSQCCLSAIEIDPERLLRYRIEHEPQSLFNRKPEPRFDIFGNTDRIEYSAAIGTYPE